MTIANKLRGLMHLKGVNMKELAKSLAINPSTLSSKFSKNNFTASDLIKIADILGYELCFLAGEHKVSLDISNIEKPQ